MLARRGINLIKRGERKSRTFCKAFRIAAWDDTADPFLKLLLFAVWRKFNE
jgi:hypothetical protein